MQAAAVLTAEREAKAAAVEIGEQLLERLGAPPQAILLFATPSLDHSALLHGIRQQFPEAIITGASSAGEFLNGDPGEGRVATTGFLGPDVRFGVGLARNIPADPKIAGQEIVSGFGGLQDYSFPYRTAVVMADALAGYVDLLVEEMTIATGGQYQFFGGGAGDNAQFRKTSVFCGTEVLDGAAVALEIQTMKPIGIGVRHGWQPVSQAYRVTEADGARLVSLNGLPAVRAFEAHARRIGQNFDREDPIPFFLHNVLGIDTGSGHRLRVPLSVQSDGSILCAAQIDTGAVVHIMGSTSESTLSAAEEAAQAALNGIGECRPKMALLFDCVATRLRIGGQFADEVTGVRACLGGIDVIGCNTHGQIARANGQFGGFHNCTAVVAVLPDQ